MGFVSTRHRGPEPTEGTGGKAQGMDFLPSLKLVVLTPPGASSPYYKVVPRVFDR